MTGQRLAGKTALITAAGQRIGRAIAELFAKQGACVVATDINEAALAELSGLPDATAGCAQPRRHRRCQQRGRRRGRAGQLCWASWRAAAILDNTEDEWAASFDINVTSMYRMIRATLPGMIERGGGSIVNISSVAGSIKGVPNRCIYGTTKAAIIGLTKSVAADFIARGIRCNAICPGTVATPSLEARLRATGDY